ncbi:hypothetical protein ACG873_06015 [Mesorhizobium sp. AaZ16]|uniref:hypothetical protein n=1 Tax=Mesorhizobium sp. AaZ16 TaxID=3402289 RepID=UPI00374FD3ED
MIQTIKQSLQNGLIFIEDIKGGEPPSLATDEKVQFSASCISVACLHEIDGEAELIFGPADEVAPTYDLAFDGTLETPSREVVVATVTGAPLLKAKVPDVRTRVRVWRSHPIWPEQVAIGWG